VLAVVTVLYGCGMVCVLLRECGSGKRENLGKERPPKQYPPLAASQCRRGTYSYHISRTSNSYLVLYRSCAQHHHHQ
jgi:hypothetical protein